MNRTARIVFAILRTAIGVGLLVYLGTSGAIHWSDLLGLAAAWPVTGAALLLLLIDAGVTAWRLCVLLRPRGLRLSLYSSLRLTLMGTFFNTCLPGSAGGDMIKIYYATEGNRGHRTEIATIMLLDRAAGMFALLIWPLLAVPFISLSLGSTAVLRVLLGIAAVVATVMLLGMVVCFSTRVRNHWWVSWTLDRLPLGNYVEKMFDTVHAYRQNAITLLAAVGISLLAHTMSIGVLLLMAVATNPSEVKWEMSLLIPLGMLANTLPLTPGGLGVGEAVFDKLFGLAGLTGGAEILLGWRLLTILVGLLGLVLYLQGRKRFVHAAETFPSMDAVANRT